MRLLASSLCALMLAACAHDEPGVRVVTQTVVKEVQRPCAATKPKRPDPLARPLPVDPVQLAALLAAKLAEYALPGGYADKADAAIELCTAATPN